MKISLRICGVVLGILLAAALTTCRGGTADTTPISMITPYKNSSDMLCINEAFSSSASAPWGFAHSGIDCWPNGNFRPFQAVCSGVVDRLELYYVEEISEWHVNLGIKYNDTYSVLYLFEPGPLSTRSDAETQLANIRVSLGDHVSQGDIIGNFYTTGGDWAIVDFGLLKDGVRICPEPYFTPEARDSILSLLHVRHPGANMCYYITLDTTAPSDVSVMIDNGAASTSSTTVTLSIAATDSIGVTGYYISETSTTPSAMASGWTLVESRIPYSADVPFVLSSGDGTKTIYVWFKDHADNVSAPASASITLDTTAPSNVSVMIDNGAANTSSTTVMLSIAATDNTGVTGYYASETSTTPSAMASGWTLVTSTIRYSADVPFILSSGDGTKTIYVWFKDDAGNVSAPATASITLDTTAPIMITPYKNTTDMAEIREAFSSSASAPWRFEHNGIDFRPNGNLKPFQAVCSGLISCLELWGNATSDWHVGLDIKYNDTYTARYLFEPGSGTTRADAEAQLADIRVSLWDHVSQGDIIGYLHVVGDPAFVHFGLVKDGVWICPEPYFTLEARDSILSRLHILFPGANMCY